MLHCVCLNIYLDGLLTVLQAYQLNMTLSIPLCTEGYMNNRTQFRLTQPLFIIISNTTSLEHHRVFMLYKTIKLDEKKSKFLLDLTSDVMSKLQ